jgi:hypothetical protein
MEEYRVYQIGTKLYPVLFSQSQLRRPTYIYIYLFIY